MLKRYVTYNALVLVIAVFVPVIGYVIIGLGQYWFIAEHEDPELGIKIPAPKRGKVTLFGRVTESGIPLYGVRISEVKGQSTVGNVCTTDHSGIYILENVACPSVSGEVHYFLNSGLQDRSMQFTVESSPGSVHRADFEFVKGNAVLEGRVLREGQPEVEWVSITGQSETETARTRIKIDAMGFFRQMDLPPGTYKVLIEGIELEEGKNPLSVTLQQEEMKWCDFTLN